MRNPESEHSLLLRPIALLEHDSVQLCSVVFASRVCVSTVSAGEGRYSHSRFFRRTDEVYFALAPICVL